MRRAAIVAGLIAFGALALADTITLKDGTKVEGTIVMETDQSVIVKTLDGKTTNIKRADIKSLVKGGPKAKLAKAKYKCRRCYDGGRMKCVGCGGSGKLKGDKCTECQGFGRRGCDACTGKGSTPCARCRGTGTVYVAGHYEHSNSRTSRYISGRNVTCTTCRGRGNAACKKCKGKGKETCFRCNGVGRQLVGGSCERCKGIGKMPCPYCDKGRSAIATPGIGGTGRSGIGTQGMIGSNSGSKAERISQIEAQIASLQQELMKLKFKEPSQLAMRQYSAMSDPQRQMVRELRDKLRAADGFEFYKTMDNNAKNLIRRSVLLREVLQDLDYAQRLAREELR